MHSLAWSSVVAYSCDVLLKFSFNLDLTEATNLTSIPQDMDLGYTSRDPIFSRGRLPASVCTSLAPNATFCSSCFCDLILGSIYCAGCIRQCNRLGCLSHAHVVSSPVAAIPPRYLPRGGFTCRNKGYHHRTILVRIHRRREMLSIIVILPTSMISLRTMTLCRPSNRLASPCRSHMGLLCAGP